MEYLVLSPISSTAIPTHSNQPLPAPLADNPSPTFVTVPPLFACSDTIYPSLATHRTREFAEVLSRYCGATQAEWTAFVDNHFDVQTEVPRFLINLTGTSGLLLADVPAVTLPLFFEALNPKVESWSLNLGNHLESAEGNQPEYIVTSFGTWTMIYGWGEIKLHVKLVAVWVPSRNRTAYGTSLKMSTCELTVVDWESSEDIDWKWGLPEKAIRVLNMIEQMEAMSGVFGLVERGLKPKAALREVTIERAEAKESQSSVLLA